MALVRVLLAVADSGSVSRAATVLAVDRGTVTRRLAELEAAAGTALLVRHSGGVKLTHAGRRLADAAAAVADAMGDFQDTLETAADGEGDGTGAAEAGPHASAPTVSGARDPGAVTGR